MDRDEGLVSGAKVAVVGGGAAGAAAAVALLQAARTRARSVEVQVFDSHRDEASIRPLVLTPECRSRLAGLGCRVDPSWRSVELSGIDVISEGRVETLPAPGGALWVVDGWPTSDGGLRMMADQLALTARAHGARVVSRQVESVTRQPLAPGGEARVAKSAGELVVRANGAADRFHAAVLAAGAGDSLRDRFFEGYAGPPTVPAAHARLGLLVQRRLGPQRAKLVVAPLPGVDLLWLIPCGSTVYALAVGPTAQPADLCQAAMAAARDGHLAESFEVEALSTLRVPMGAGTRLTARGQVAVGNAAFGHPLDLGLSQTLASVTRGASALVECGENPRRLKRRYMAEGILEQLEDANAGAAALPWLRRAGKNAAKVFARARARSPLALPFNGGVLGLPSPSPSSLLSSARWSGLGQSILAWLRPVVDPLPASALMAEPDLYYVVDDDPAARDALTGFLEAQGAQVVSFADELALYCAVARRPPTAILLDVVLNWVDGLRLCEGLQQHPLTRRTPVFVMSGLNRPHVKARALEAGAKAFFAKPLDPQMLLQVLHQHHVGPRAHRQRQVLQAVPAVDDADVLGREAANDADEPFAGLGL